MHSLQPALEMTKECEALKLPRLTAVAKSPNSSRNLALDLGDLETNIVPLTEEILHPAFD